MKKLNELSAAAQEVSEEIFENGRSAYEMADALCDADVLSQYDWDASAVEEAFDWYNDLARFITVTGSRELMIDGHKKSLAEAADDCGLSAWSVSVTGDVYCGDSPEDCADRVLESIMTAYDNRGVLCEEC